MKDTERKYESPHIEIIDMQAEQAFLTGSSGQNESLFEDPNDFFDYFE
ncbi:MAG: hypothetical protein IJ271_07625 [Bacteroidales bacterium]|nr:hypothetical protein [Bacteroidales bacterium]